MSDSQFSSTFAFEADSVSKHIPYQIDLLPYISYTKAAIEPSLHFVIFSVNVSNMENLHRETLYEHLINFIHSLLNIPRSLGMSLFSFLCIFSVFEQKISVLQTGMAGGSVPK